MIFLFFTCSLCSKYFGKIRKTIKNTNSFAKKEWQREKEMRDKEKHKGDHPQTNSQNKSLNCQNKQGIFSGSFDGGGYTISFSNPINSFELFACGSGAIVQNLILLDVSFSSAYAAQSGSFCNSFQISNIFLSTSDPSKSNILSSNPFSNLYFLWKPSTALQKACLTISAFLSPTF